MAFKSQLGAGLLLAVCVVCGCQNTPPRNPTPPGFTQRPSVPPAEVNEPAVGHWQPSADTQWGTPVLLHVSRHLWRGPDHHPGDCGGPNPFHATLHYW